MTDTAPYQLAPQPPTRLLHCASARFAEQQDLTRRSVHHVDHGAPMPVLEDSEENREAPEPVTLGLAIRRTRLIAFTLTMLAIIVGFTVWFHHGFALSHFDSRDKNVTEQTKLLDDYNSYSGNVATIFATPVELFVTVAVQVIVLRFMADTFTRPEMSWKISGITLLLGAGVGYMISNGFNALNVQLRPETIRSAISAVDLGLDDVIEMNGDSVSELAPANPVMNTILRSTFSQEILTGDGVCPFTLFRGAVNTVNGTVDEVGHSFLNLGFPQREWQSRVLQEALPSDTLRLVVNPTNKSINSGVTSSALPMEAATGALLFDYAMTIGPSFFPWGGRRDYINQSDFLRRYPVNDSGTHNITDDLYRLFGLLPSDDNASDETARREFFVSEALAAASRQFAKSSRTKTSDITMEFSHTQIAPHINFSALTFEVDIDPDLLATSTSTSADNKTTTRHTVLDQIYNCPGSSKCLVPKPRYSSVEPFYDVPVQMVGFLICTDAEGVERIDADVTIQNYTIVRNATACYVLEDKIPSSMLIVSIGKRLVADELEQNVSVSANGTKVDDNESVTVTNLRKIYSFTVGRLDWELTNLGEQFNAECDAGDEGECIGLELPLSIPVHDTTTVQNGADQRLVVGKSKLYAMQRQFTGVSLRLNYAKTELLSLNEPPHIPSASPLYRIMSGDLLLPHNLRKVTWDATFVQPECDFEVEYRIGDIYAKHHYMEHSLQAAYTAGIFQIFKSAVVRDVISLSSSVKSLAFQGNSQSIAVWVSTPSQNMWLTLGGCFVLVAGLLGAVVTTMWFAPKEKDALANITEPHAIARVMMDERHYPPIFLHRRILEKGTVGTVDEFAIAGLSLHQQQQQQRREQQQLQEQGRQMVESKPDSELGVAFIP